MNTILRTVGEILVISGSLTAIVLVMIIMLGA